MSTKNLRAAVQATSAAGQADLGEVLQGLRAFCVALDRAVGVSLLALADPEASGTLDAALVEELMESPQSVSFFATYLHLHATPESAVLVKSLIEEMVEAAAYAQPPEDTVPESWTAE